MPGPFLAMSDAVQMTLVVGLVTFVGAVTPAIIGLLWSLSRKIDGQRTEIRELKAQTDRVEKQTNGNLSEEKAKVSRAETRLPSVTHEYPPGTEITARMSVNDTNNNDPPVVVERVSREGGEA